MDFLKWYKNTIEESDLNPPENIWENIQDQLDIDNSWQAIRNHLVKEANKRKVRFLSYAASVLLFLSFAGYFFINTDLLTDETELVSEKFNEIKQLDKKTNRKNELSVKESKLKERYFDKSSKSKTYYANKAEIKEVQIEADTKVDDKILPDLIRSLKNHPVSLDDTMHQNLILAKVYNPVKYNEPKAKETNAFKKLYVGATGQIANTWLLNEKTYSGIEGSSLTTANASFGSNIGIYVGTNLFDWIDLQLDLNILVKNNQNYNEYLDGKYIENNLSFSYSHVSPSARFYINSKKFMQGEHALNVGAYAGYLHSAYQILDGKTINLTDYYNNYDFGVFIAYEYVMPLTNKLGLGTGVRAYYGFQNIYSGNEFIPSYLNKTTNASVNISLSLKYRIK